MVGPDTQGRADQLSCMSRKGTLDTDRAGRLDEAEQPDGRFIIYRESPAAATESGRWIVGDTVEITR